MTDDSCYIMQQLYMSFEICTRHKINKLPKGNNHSSESQQVQSLDKVVFVFFFFSLKI